MLQWWRSEGREGLCAGSRLGSSFVLPRSDVGPTSFELMSYKNNSSRDIQIRVPTFDLGPPPTFVGVVFLHLLQ